MLSFVWPHLSAALSNNLSVSSLRVDLSIGVLTAGAMAVLDSMPNVYMAVIKLT